MSVVQCELSCHQHPDDGDTDNSGSVVGDQNHLSLSRLCVSSRFCLQICFPVGNLRRLMATEMRTNGTNALICLLSINMALFEKEGRKRLLRSRQPVFWCFEKVCDTLPKLCLVSFLFSSSSYPSPTFRSPYLVSSVRKPLPAVDKGEK